MRRLDAICSTNGLHPDLHRRDDDRWKKAKEAAGKVGVFTIEILKQVLSQRVQTQLKQVMGT